MSRPKKEPKHGQAFEIVVLASLKKIDQNLKQLNRKVEALAVKVDDCCCKEPPVLRPTGVQIDQVH